ncbi:MAG: class I SAM-dependent methyltransferase, partial [Methylocystaceae bacterium]|nr:class I SAM-dependent methyltransferase [Methylocystaceae bacterium]
IMSFGCSTGEEVFSLRARLPSAEIIGLDINPRAIAACEKHLAAAPRDLGIRFICKGSAEGEEEASYDAIFCMAVLRHGDLQASRPARCDAVLEFALAERTVTELARCLKPGGLLAIWNCHFRFADMAVAAQFEVAYSSAEGAWANQPLYGRDNCLLPRALYCEAIFRKRSF